MSRFTILRTIIPVVWRPALVAAILEVPLLIGVSALVAFFVSLPLKGPMDGLLFHLRAAYDTVGTAPTSFTGALRADRFVGFPIAPRPGPGESLQFTPLATRLHLDLVADIPAYQAIAIGGNLASSSGSGIVLDKDSAIHMGVEVGDEVVLLLGHLLDGAPSPVVRIAALVEPYAIDPATHAVGLAAIDRDDLPAEVVTQMLTVDLVSVVREELYFNPPTSAESRSRTETAASFVLQLFSADWLPVLGTLLTSALLLYAAVLARGASHILRRTQGSSAVIVSLGTSSSTTASATTLPQLLLWSSCSIIGTAIVAMLVFPVILRSTLQLGAALPAVALLLLVVLGANAVSQRRVEERLRSQGILRLLAATDG